MSESDTIKIADYSSGNSSSLKEIDGKAFTIVNVERSDYDDNLGVILTVEEDYNETKRFHTTRKVIVEKFLDKDKETKKVIKTELCELVNNNGKKLHVKCIEIKVDKGNNYFVLEDVDDKGMKAEM